MSNILNGFDLEGLDDFINDADEGTIQEKNINYKRTDNTTSVLLLSLEPGDVIKDTRGIYYKFKELECSEPRHVVGIGQVALCLNDNGYVYNDMKLYAGHKYTRVSKEEYEEHLLTIKDNRTNSQPVIKKEPKYTLGVTEIDGSPAVYMKDRITGEKVLIDVSNELEKLILDSYVHNKKDNKFSTSKKLTEIKCDNCGTYLQERTVDYINRRQDKLKGTDKEGLYYCIHCQHELFNRNFYDSKGGNK